MTFGTKLLRLREKKNVTRDYLAQQIGVSKVAYGKWESDISKPNMENLIRVCDFYELMLSELLSNVSNIHYKNDELNDSCNLTYLQTSNICYPISVEIMDTLLANQQKITELVSVQSLLIANILHKKM